MLHKLFQHARPRRYTEETRPLFENLVTLLFPSFRLSILFREGRIGVK